MAIADGVAQTFERKIADRIGVEERANLLEGARAGARRTVRASDRGCRFRVALAGAGRMREASEASNSSRVGVSMP